MHFYTEHACMHMYGLYSNSNTSGSFSTDGITQSNTTNSTFVQCTSTHLTSFAVLVDMSGDNESVSLTVCTYNAKLPVVACTVQGPTLQWANR